MTPPRVTHRHIQAACHAYNERHGFAYPSVGYLQWTDIGGFGARYRPGLYVQTNERGGVCQSNLRQPGQTLRALLEAINNA